MNSPFRDLFSGLMGPRRPLVGAMTPRRSFDDVVLPPKTYRALNQALAQIRYHDLIFQQWGLGERHDTGLGLAFNFAGPPGTGKTICAEAIANALGKRLLVVRYSEMESMWVGETGKNVAAVFRMADEQEAVLFFDEADAIASRRSTGVQHGHQREMNTVVNVLLRELDEFSGVVIFATNLAANFDPAFERRIRTHILFERPGIVERELIWKVQLHPRKTPLADDVDFHALAERYDVTGGDIKNAVVKAAQLAADEPGTEAERRIHQRHFQGAIEDVLAGKRVMEQSLFSDDADAGLQAAGPLATVMGQQNALEDNLSALATRLVEVEDRGEEITSAVRALRQEIDESAELRAVSDRRGEETTDALREISSVLGRVDQEIRQLTDSVHRRQSRERFVVWIALLALLLALAAAAFTFFG
jgi:DNA polymerase III delta prime subunit